MKTLAVITLGCDKNRVDTEKMLANLAGGNFVLSPEDEAQIIIINTCAFIEAARKEAIETILHCAKYKQKKCEKLIVTGCLPQKYLEELKNGLPEADAFLGVNEYANILNVIDGLYNSSPSKDLPLKPADENARIITTPFTYAYLKVSDGCNNRCTYCNIPSIRGNYRSQTIDSLVKETESLVSKGVKEVILVGQDVTNYGIDLYKKRNLVELIRALSKTEIESIRLMYCYPDLIGDELINEIKNNEKVIKYLDIPLQHIDDRILSLMGRRGGSQTIINLINKLRREIPEIALRTTFITGFPTETETEFIKLRDFIKEYKFNHAGVFTYSLEKDTPSARLQPRIDKKTSRARQKELMLSQQQNVIDFNKKSAGKIFKVRYEGIDYKKNLFYGRAYFSAPEVDTLVYFTADFADFGLTYDIKITGSSGYDLLGKKI